MMSTETPKSSKRPKSKLQRRGEVAGCLFLLLFLSFAIAVIIPIYRAAQPVSKRTAALAAAKEVALAIQMYTNDSDDRMPPLKSAGAVEKLIEPYLTHGGDADTLQSAAKTYQWNVVLSAKNIGDFPEPAKTWMLHSTAEVQKAYAIAFLDGRAQSVTSEELAACLSKPTRHLK